jgi:hypothetical protein
MKFSKVSIALLLLLILTGCFSGKSKTSSEAQAESIPSPSPTISPVSSTSSQSQASLESEPQTDNFEDAVLTADLAEGVSKNAINQEDWKLVASQLQEAIRLMKTVPQSSKNYSTAQEKIKEYESKLANINKPKNIVANNSNTVNDPKPVLETPKESPTDFMVKTLDKVTQEGYSFPVYWCKHTEKFATDLFNPYQYQILNEFQYSKPVGEDGTIASYNVRIWSTNRGGQEILATWKFYIATEKTNTKFSKKGDYCISLLSES